MANYYKTLNEAFDSKFNKILEEDREDFDEALSDEDKANNEMIKRLYDKPESKWTKSEKEFANKHNLYRNKSYPNQEIRNRKTGKSLADIDVHKAVSGNLHKPASSIFNNEMNQLDYLNTPYNSYAPRGNNAYGYFDDKLSKNSSNGDYAPYLISQNNKKRTIANKEYIAQKKSRIASLTKEAEQAAERYGETGDERDKYNMERYLRQIEDEKRYLKRQEKQNDLDYVFNAGQLPESLTEDMHDDVQEAIKEGKNVLLLVEPGAFPNPTISKIIKQSRLKDTILDCGRVTTDDLDLISTELNKMNESPFILVLEDFNRADSRTRNMLLSIARNHKIGKTVLNNLKSVIAVATQFKEDTYGQNLAPSEKKGFEIVNLSNTNEALTEDAESERRKNEPWRFISPLDPKYIEKVTKLVRKAQKEGRISEKEANGIISGTKKYFSNHEADREISKRSYSEALTEDMEPMFNTDKVDYAVDIIRGYYHNNLNELINDLFSNEPPYKDDEFWAELFINVAEDLCMKNKITDKKLADTFLDLPTFD